MGELLHPFEIRSNNPSSYTVAYLLLQYDGKYDDNIIILNDNINHSS